MIVLIPCFSIPGGSRMECCQSVQNGTAFPSGYLCLFLQTCILQVTEVLNAGNIDVTGSYPHPVSVVEYHQVVIALRRIIGHDGLFPFAMLMVATGFSSGMKSGEVEAYTFTCPFSIGAVSHLIMAFPTLFSSHTTDIVAKCRNMTEVPVGWSASLTGFCT